MSPLMLLFHPLEVEERVIFFLFIYFLFKYGEREWKKGYVIYINYVIKEPNISLF
jgi:hypothetical protein